MHRKLWGNETEKSYRPSRRTRAGDKGAQHGDYVLHHDSSPNIRSLIPARIDRLPWSKFHTRLVVALGRRLGPRRPRDHHRGQRRARPDPAQHAEPGRGRGRRHRLVVPDRRGHRRAVLRPAVRQARPQEPVRDHPRRLPDRQRAHRGDPRRRPLDHLPLRHPDHRRHGHRRRVRRDQLGDRRDDPRAYRGRIDIAVNGTYWGGALIGTVITLVVLNHVAAEWGWRIAYLVGPVLALCIIYVRRNLPESPRWQIMHGREAEAEASIREIEEHVERTKGALPPGRPQQETRDHADRPDRLPPPADHAVPDEPDAVHPGLRAHVHPVLPLQRHLLHLRPGA